MQETQTGGAIHGYTELGKPEFVARATQTWNKFKGQMPAEVRREIYPIFVALPSQLGVSPDEVDGDLSE